MAKDKIYLHFLNALKKQQHPRIKNYILNDGVDPNIQFSDGVCPIHIAAQQGDVETLKLLLSLKVFPNVKDRRGNSALMLGIENEEVVRTLLAYGCNTELCDRWKKTALHLSAGKGLYSITQLLVDAKASLNNVDKDKRTPLHIALLNVSMEEEETFIKIVTVLVEKGAHVNRGDKFGETPLCLAVKSGIASFAELLISKGADVNKPGRHRITPLILSVMDGKSSMVELLVKQNCNVNIENPITHKSCLQLAVENGFIDIVKILVAAGIKIHNEKIAQLQALPDMDESLREYLNSLVSKPQKLRELCRSFIRQHLGSPIEQKLKKLCYPKILKEFLLLNDTSHLYYADQD